MTTDEFIEKCHKYGNDIRLCELDKNLYKYYLDNTESIVNPSKINFASFMQDTLKEEIFISGDLNSIILGYSITDDICAAAEIILDNKTYNFNIEKYVARWIFLDKGTLDKIVDKVPIGCYVKLSITSELSKVRRSMHIKSTKLLEYSTTPMFPHYCCPECGADYGVCFDKVTSMFCEECSVPLIKRDDITKSVNNYN